MHTTASLLKDLGVPPRAVQVILGHARVHFDADLHARRLAPAGVIAFYGVNGRRLTLTNDEAYELVRTVADGTLDGVEEIADRLARSNKPW